MKEALLLNEMCQIEIVDSQLGNEHVTAELRVKYGVGVF